MKKITEVRSLPCFIRANPRLFAVFRLPPSNDRGIALVMTLTLLAILLIMLLAFVTSMRTERLLTKNFNDLAKARLLADAAVERAVAMLRRGTPALTNAPVTIYWSGPGLVVSNFNGIVGQVPLSSGDGTEDLNKGGIIAKPAADYPMKLEWLPVTHNGELVGRYLFWVDDESAKINLNAAWKRGTANPRSTANSSDPTEIDFTALLRKWPLATDGIRQQVIPAPNVTNLFNTPREVIRADPDNLDEATFEDNKFFVSSFQKSEPNVDSFGNPRIDLNNIEFLIQGLRSRPVAQSPGGTQWRDMWHRPSNWGDMEKAIWNVFTNEQWSTIYPNITDKKTLLEKFGNGDISRGEFSVQQIIANIIQFAESDSSDATFSGRVKDPIMSPLDSNGIPLEYCGLKKDQLFLNEIVLYSLMSAGTFSSTTTPPTWLVTNQVHVVVEWINPTGQRMPLADMFVVGKPASITVNPPSGATIESVLFADLSMQQMALPANVMDTPTSRRKYFTREGGRSVGFRWDTIMLVRSNNRPDPYQWTTTVQMEYVKFLRSPTVATSIRDWATRSDFPVLVMTNVPSLSANIDARGDRFDQARGIGKNDPRVRTFPGASTGLMAWQPELSGYRTTRGDRVTPSFDTPVVGGGQITGRQNAPDVVKWAGLPLGTRGDGSVAHPALGVLVDNIEVNGQDPANISTFFVKGAPFESVGELGYIHTGLPWRTIRLQSVVPVVYGFGGTPVTLSQMNRVNMNIEFDDVPDWILLDAFKVSSAEVPPGSGRIKGQININSLLRPFAPNVNIKRLLPLDALTWNFAAFTGLPNLNNSFIPANIATNAYVSFDPASGESFDNPYMDPSPQNRFYRTPGEICEIEGIITKDPTTTSGNPNRTDADREAIIRKIAHLITVRSNVFTVWGMAQSIKDVNKNGTFDNGTDIITGEVKVQAIVERYEDPTVPVTDPSRVKFRTLYFRYLYD
jgi:hypothetical protein